MGAYLLIGDWRSCVVHRDLKSPLKRNFTKNWDFCFSVLHSFSGWLLLLITFFSISKKDLEITQFWEKDDAIPQDASRQKIHGFIVPKKHWQKAWDLLFWRVLPGFGKTPRLDEVMALSCQRKSVSKPEIFVILLSLFFSVSFSVEYFRVKSTRHLGRVFGILGL